MRKLAVLILPLLLAATPAVDARQLFRHAVTEAQAGRLEAAIVEYQQVLDQKPQFAWLVMYDLACAHAQLKHADEAIAWLDKAIKAGPVSPESLDTDSDLVSVRGDRRFPALREAADRAVNPCKYSTVAHQLDFWLGAWDVTDANSKQPVGQSHIDSISGGCAVLENWSGGLGGSGKSLNFVDKNGKWRQTWVGSDNSVTEFTGALDGSAMRFYADGATPDGKKTVEKLSFEPLAGGSVRQHHEQSLDGGKTWKAVYDFIYARAAKK